MAVEEFYIVILGKKKFIRELTLLFQNFALLPEKDDRKAFLRYLKSGYPLKDQLLHKLFPILYKRYENGNRLIQGKRLIASLLGHDDEAKGGRRLKQLIILLTNEVLRFRAIIHLEKNPVEFNRLVAKAVSNQVRPNVYQRVLQQLEVAVADLPMGLEKCLRTWEVAYFGHFSLSAPKERINDTLFDRLGPATRDLSAMLKLIYQAEAINRTAIWGGNDEEVVSIPLVELYKGLIALGLEERFQADLYEEVRRLFLTLAPRLSDVQRFSVVAHLVNYLNRQHRKGIASANRRILEWTSWQLRGNVYPTFRVLSKTWFLNQISNAVALGEFEIAQKVIDVQQHRLDADDRTLAIIHGNVLILLGEDHHFQAYSMITRAFHDHHLLPHTDGIRLKSIRLMSALCLYAGDPTEWSDQYDLALRDLEVYLGRHEQEIELNRWQFYRNMLIVIRKCQNQLAKRGNLDKVYQEITQRLATSEPLHAREWLQAFIGHFPPGRAPVLPVRPFAYLKQQNNQSP